jgi:hypothetical protein
MRPMPLQLATIVPGPTPHTDLGALGDKFAKHPMERTAAVELIEDEAHDGAHFRLCV